MKYPFVKQTGSKDCAAASLLMIIKYYGGDIKLSELSEKLKITNTGTSAFNLIKISKELGFEAKGLKQKLENIKPTKLPVIAHLLTQNNYYHFCVIYKINHKRKYLIIADPATKLKKISFKEFEKIFTGVILLLKPKRSIPIISEEIKITTYIKQVLKSNREEFKLIYILSILITLFSVISSFYMKFLIDNIEGTGIIILFSFFSFITLLGIISEFLRGLLLSHFNKNIGDMLIFGSFKKILLLPFHYYFKRTSGELIEKITDLESVKVMIVSLLINLIVDIPLMMVSFFILFSISTQLSFVTLCTVIFILIVNFISNKIIKNKILELKQKRELMYTEMIDGITSFETIKGLNNEKEAIECFSKKYFDFATCELSLNKVLNVKAFADSFIFKISNLTLLYFGFLLVKDGDLSLSLLVAYNTVNSYFMNPITKLSDSLLIYNKGKEAFQKITSVFEKEESKLKLNNGKNYEIKNLNFSYDDLDTTLKDVTLNINEGEKIFITGKSGSGKSTLLKLLKGFNKVDRNMIKIDDFDINDITNFSNVIIVPASGTIKSGKLMNQFKKKSYKKVFDIANVTEVIKNNKDGYNMIIDENAGNLSMGERQRIVLARALTKKFDMLVLDESLSNLDINLERKILKKIISKYKSKTIIYISHRLNNMDLFDRNIQLAGGMVTRDVKRK